MIHTAELAKAVARTEQARQKKAKVLDMIMRSINETEALIGSHGARHAVTKRRTQVTGINS